MKHTIRNGVAMLAATGVLVAGLAAPAAASEPLGGCPSGGGWALISPTSGPYPWGPAAARVDQQGNNDGYACKTVFTNGSGMVVGQVIDNRVQAGS
jgi:hypothetical protein